MGYMYLCILCLFIGIINTLDYDHAFNDYFYNTAPYTLEIQNTNEVIVYSQEYIDCIFNTHDTIVTISNVLICNYINATGDTCSDIMLTINSSNSKFNFTIYDKYYICDDEDTGSFWHILYAIFFTFIIVTFIYVFILLGCVYVYKLLLYMSENTEPVNSITTDNVRNG